MHTSHTKGDVLYAFGAYLDEIGVPYVIVGDTSRYPEKIDSDVDIVFPASQIIQCDQIIQSFADQTGLRLVQLLQHERCARYYVLTWNHTAGTNSIALDVCSDFVENGRPFLDASALLSGRCIATAEDGAAKGFYVPAPDMEFIYYLLKKINKISLTDRQFKHLRSQFLQCPAKCLARLQEFWLADECEGIAKWLRDGDGDLLALQKSIHYLRQKLTAKCRPSIKERWHEFLRKVRRVLQPTGLVIVLLGPDGCGKSTIGERLQEEVAPAFRGLRPFHLRPYFLRRTGGTNGAPVIDPHGLPPRSAFTSLAKLFYFLFDYVCGYWLLIRPLKVRSHLVMFDRYYHDMLIDPRRYRYGAPLWLARWIGCLVPGPDLYLILDAPSEVIQSRKQEVPFAETERQRHAYLTFARKKGNCIVINTDQALEKVVSGASDAVFDYMEKRLRARMDIRS